MQRRIQESNDPYVVLVIPLLVESGQTDLADRILVVDTPEALQLERVQRRDRQTTGQVRAIMQAQCNRRERLAVADDVIRNDGSLEKLRMCADELHQKYLSLAQNG